MKASVLSRFPEESVRLEGYVPYMYLDVKGLVTTGIGNLIDPMSLAMNLPWKMGSMPATQAQIADEWTLVKSNTTLAKHGHLAAKGITKLRLDKEDVERLVSSVMARFYGILKHRFPDIDTWPADAQMATMSMAWACGPWFRFANLESALKSRNFTLASVSCQISTAGNPGVAPRNVMNIILYGSAAACEAGKLKGDVVHFGGERTGKRLQTLLNASTIDPKLKVDGQVGPKTREAVKRFQGSQGLDQDGIAGVLTWGRLEEAGLHPATG